MLESETRGLVLFQLCQCCYRSLKDEVPRFEGLLEEDAPGMDQAASTGVTV